VHPKRIRRWLELYQMDVKDLRKMSREEMRDFIHRDDDT
jgi:hypothetical protein